MSKSLESVDNAEVNLDTMTRSRRRPVLLEDASLYLVLYRKAIQGKMRHPK